MFAGVAPASELSVRLDQPPGQAVIEATGIDPGRVGALMFSGDFANWFPVAATAEASQPSSAMGVVAAVSSAKGRPSRWPSGQRARLDGAAATAAESSAISSLRRPRELSQHPPGY